MNCRGNRFACGLFVACLCLAPILSFTAHAQGITLAHDSWWEIQGRTVTIHVSIIENGSGEDTGPLNLSLYAKGGTVYDGAGSPGQLLARVAIDSIPAGQSAQNLTLTTRVRASRPGMKFSALTVERKNGRKYEIVDWVVYTSLYAFPRNVGGGVGSDDSAIGRGNIAVSNPSLEVTRRRATFTVDQIQSQREVGLTGTLRLAVYVNDGGAASGNALGAVILGQLAPGDYFNNLHGTIAMRNAPRNSSPDRLLVVEEQTDGGWVRVN